MSAKIKGVKRKLSKLQDPIDACRGTNPPRSNLCTRCKELGLEEVLRDVKVSRNCSVKIADVGQYYRHQWAYGCGLCHILSASRVSVDQPREKPTDHEDGDVLRVFNLCDDLTWTSTSDTESGRWNKLWHGQSSLYLAVLPSKMERYRADLKRHGERNGFMAIRRRGTPQPQKYAPQIVSPLFDLSLARYWLQYCKDHHKGACSEKKKATTELHLIDCDSLEVIPAPDQVDYIALSYVWGERATSNGPLESTILPGLNGRRLPSPMPAVIADAISTTIGLGFHYLWVDRYCINQDSHSKHEQISQMDSIYQNSEVTIVAAAGGGPEYGLSGINTRTRCGQQTCTIGDFDIISTMRHPHGTIESSKWSSRGWTFQEAALSRRNLFFTDDQVYFECNAMNCHESLSSNLDQLHTEDKSQFVPILRGGLFGRARKQTYGFFDEGSLEPSKNLVRFMALVEQYTARDLTYDTDSLNAFAGIIRKFETAKAAVCQIWGVPFCRGECEQQTSDSFLDGLTWSHKTTDGNHPRRRPGFPSWSWAGWAGEVEHKYRRWGDWTMSLFESEVERICLETDGGKEVAISVHIDQAKDSQTISPSVIHVRARALPVSAFSCDTSITPPELRIFRYRTRLALSVGPWDASHLYQSLLRADRRQCVHIGRVECWDMIWVLQAEDDRWSRVGLIYVPEAFPYSFYTSWKEFKTKSRDGWLKWPVISSRDIGEEVRSFRII